MLGLRLLMTEPRSSASMTDRRTPSIGRPDY
jgi:hypothetical protein